MVKRFLQVRYIRQENEGKAAAALDSPVFANRRAISLAIWTRTTTGCLGSLNASPTRSSATTRPVFCMRRSTLDRENKYLYGSEAATELSVLQPPLHRSRDGVLLCSIYRPRNAISGSLGAGNTICVRRDASTDCFPLPTDLGVAIDRAILLSAAHSSRIHLSEKLSAYRHHGNNSFVSMPGSVECQSRLLQMGIDNPWRLVRGKTGSSFEHFH